LENKLNVRHYNCIDKINVIQNYIEKAWENFILCEFNEGMKYFEKIMIELDGVITYISNINNGSKSDVKIENMLRILQKLEKSITNKDYVYSADLLKYEIIPILDTWKNKLGVKFNN
jgi:hypothetical protein